MSKYLKHNLFLALLLVFFGGCGDNENSGTSRLIITLVDDPAEYKEVNVDIQQVRVHRSSEAEDEEGGWIELDNSNVGVVNLLDYTAGSELVLVDTEFPVGKISQIRLVLGENNTVVVDDQELDMKTPSAQQSGLKLKVNETLVSGITYVFKLDFDAARSVVKTGNGKYILKPVIRVLTDVDGGAIKGMVEPASEHVTVYVLDGEDTVATSYARENIADFLVSGVPEGQYNVSLNPGEMSTYAEITIENIDVFTGKVVDVGTTTLEIK